MNFMFYIYRIVCWRKKWGHLGHTVRLPSGRRIHYSPYPPKAAEPVYRRVV